MQIKNISNSKILKYLIISLIIFTIFALVITYFKSEFIFNGARQSYYQNFYIIFSLSLFVWIAILAFKVQTQINILIIIFSAILSLYLIEILISKIYIAGLPEFSDSENKILFDKRSRYELLNDLIAENKDTVIYSYPSAYARFYGTNINNSNRLFPLSGVSNKNTILCNENGQYAIYKSDRYGFNNPDEEWDSSNIQYLLVGDSYAHGACVPQTSNIANQLRLETKKTVISLGSGSNGPLLELAGIIEYASILKPKIVLWVFSETNDLPDLASEKNIPFLMKYLDTDFSQNLIHKQTSIDLLMSDFSETERKINQSSAFRLERTRKLITYLFKENNKKNNITTINPSFKDILNKAKKLTQSWGGSFYFVYLPTADRYINEEPPFHRTEIINILNKINIPIIDIHNLVFENHVDRMSLFPFRAENISPHYNEKGYRETAIAIKDAIK
jgi:hypothetical protein